MRLFACLFLFACLSLFAPPTAAQEAVAERLSIGEAGTEYLRSIRLRRIDADVAYFDPTAPPPALDTNEQPEGPGAEAGAGRQIELDLPTALIAIAILLGIGYVFVRFGGTITVSLGGEAGNAERGRRGRVASAPDDEVPATLESILGLSDRREALVLLARSVLAATVAANGVLLQRSWTARDALRHIPRNQTHLDALRALVLASERVQFGGRDVTEDEFNGHLSRIRPLIEAGAA